MVIIRLKNSKDEILSTIRINSIQVVSIIQNTDDEEIVIKMSDGTTYRLTNEAVIPAIENDLRRSGGGGGGGDSGIPYDRPTNLNETIDIVMDLANRDVDDAMLGMGFSTKEGTGDGR